MKSIILLALLVNISFIAAFKSDDFSPVCVNIINNSENVWLRDDGDYKGHHLSINNFYFYKGYFEVPENITVCNDFGILGVEINDEIKLKFRSVDDNGKMLKKVSLEVKSKQPLPKNYVFTTEPKWPNDCTLTINEEQNSGLFLYSIFLT
jgi:hypothetical protein